MADNKLSERQLSVRGVADQRFCSRRRQPRPLRRTKSVGDLLASQPSVTILSPVRDIRQTNRPSESTQKQKEDHDNEKDSHENTLSSARRCCDIFKLDHRKFSSLPPCYRQRLRPAYTSQTSSAQTEKVPKVDLGEFNRRLSLMRSWFSEFNDIQKTSVMQAVFKDLGGSQLHWIATQLPGKNPGLHIKCVVDCSDPLQIFSLDVIYKILGFLDPVSLAISSQVCVTWYNICTEPLLWERLCHTPPWSRILSAGGVASQLARYRNEVDWRQVFIERYKLRRAWLSGHCHVRTFEGHTGGISCVEFDSNRIVSGSYDKTIKVWNTKTNSPWSVMTLTGHSGEVRCLHMQANKLVSGSTDLTIKVWDLDSQEEWSSIACRVTMVGHMDTIRCVQMDLDRNIVISGAHDSTVKIWDMTTGHCKNTLRGHTGSVFALQASGGRIISGSVDKTVNIWNLDSLQFIGSLVGHKEAVTCLTVDPSQQYVITGSSDRTIKVWCSKELICLRTLDFISCEGHNGVIRCLKADKWRILSSADDKSVKVWDLETGKRLVTLKSHSDGVTCIQFNDFHIVSGSFDKTVKLWDFTVC